MALNTIAVKNASMRRQTRQERRNSITLGPVQNLGQSGPVRFLLQVWLTRLSSGNNDPIELAVPQFIQAGVELIQMTLSAIGPRNSGQRVNLEKYWTVTRRDIQELKEL